LTAVAVLFWTTLLAITYPYAIYPAMLIFVNRIFNRPIPSGSAGHEPTVTILMPVHNEAGRVGSKVANLLSLNYPPEKIQLVAIADGCSDDSVARLRDSGGDRLQILQLDQWSGKAAALNAGLAQANGEIIVFTDVGIELERESLRYLIAHFADPAIGCVSGEDYIAGADSEGFYGRLELLLRREEARLYSIAGASGCFYAQRRILCRPFVAGMAPDFLSVLVTARAGYRSIAEPRARGSMTSAASQKAEFNRKVRTFLRGITALMGHVGMLNPIRYPRMSFILWSHKALRWLAPVAMVLCLVASWSLRDSLLYAVAFLLQVVAYSAAIAGLVWPALAHRLPVLRIAGFFLIVNVAALKAMYCWLSGERIEVWEPTRRP
jgi:cellulose synthase/poly-beta-1,6-N-acetylglucosamine synthase-like glycosyltransferase